jgi:lipid II:glycine glycyltransferase (peptidoglycan interpeptide bridge formation enzyme)
MEEAGFTPAQTIFDYHTTLEAALLDDSEAMLRSFRKGTRSAIRQAQRAGITTDEGGQAEAQWVESFYADMVARKGATPRPKGFFVRLAAFIEQNPDSGFLLISQLGERSLGGIFILRHGQRALYAFGASGRPERGLPMTHLLHFEAMIRARRLGCAVYDLCGFSTGTGAQGERSARQSINLFKSGFSKQSVDLLPTQEIVLRPVLYRLVEDVRRWFGTT